MGLVIDSEAGLIFRQCAAALLVAHFLHGLNAGEGLGTLQRLQVSVVVSNQG